MIGLSDLDAVAKGETDAAVGADRRVIQQLSPGLRIAFSSPSAAVRAVC